jgi:hypothetical protein
MDASLNIPPEVTRLLDRLAWPLSLQLRWLDPAMAFAGDCVPTRSDFATQVLESLEARFMDNVVQLCFAASMNRLRTIKMALRRGQARPLLHSWTPRGAGLDRGFASLCCAAFTTVNGSPLW